jgi:hypothetical protein
MGDGRNQKYLPVYSERGYRLHTRARGAREFNWTDLGSDRAAASGKGHEDGEREYEKRSTA